MDVFVQSPTFRTALQITDGETFTKAHLQGWIDHGLANQKLDSETVYRLLELTTPTVIPSSRGASSPALFTQPHATRGAAAAAELNSPAPLDEPHAADDAAVVRSESPLSAAETPRNLGASSPTLFTKPGTTRETAPDEATVVARSTSPST